MIQTSKRLDEHVDALVSELVATSSEEIERVLGIEVVMTVKVASDEVVDFLLGVLVQILKLMHGRELGNVEAIGQDSVRLALQQVLALERGNVGDGREDVTRMSRRALDAVPVVDAALPSFRVNIEPLKVVVEVNRAGAEVSAEQRGMRCEDRRNVDAALLGQWDSDASQPFMEVCYDSFAVLARDKLAGLLEQHQLTELCV